MPHGQRSHERNIIFHHDLKESVLGQYYYRPVGPGKAWTKSAEPPTLRGPSAHNKHVHACNLKDRGVRSWKWERVQ